MRKFIITILAAAAAAVSVSAQTSNVWSLQDCLDYAVENNIQIRQNRNTYLSGLEDTEQAKASLFPSLTASSSQGVTNYTLSDDPSTKYTGSYGLNADMTLYSGGKLRNAVKQQEVQNEIDSLSVTSSINDIKIAIIQAYMQCLYAQEAVKVNENTVELAQAQYDRAVEMKNAGSLSKVDVAQLESQLYSDQYQLTVAKTSLDSYLLALKQLLELDILDEIQLSGAEASEEDVLQLIPEKTIVYQNALAYLPEVRSADLSVTSAELALKTAKAGYSPTLGLSAGAGASNMSGTGNNFTTQIQNNFNLNAGLTLSIPIFSNRKNKTAVNKAKYTLANSELTKLNTEKTVLKEVESTYLDAVSAQAQYVSAKQQEQYAQTSYDLTNEQFSLGMKNIVELIEAKNNLLSASQSRLQAKYMALLNLEVLDVYQGK
ncbi:MAG: TolC family protein [Bacteroidales bacterium]|nr:TolC family protein [Bacteroidales bacterium]